MGRDMDMGKDEQDQDQDQDQEQSPFEKWFWENRGENNRVFKSRRRESMKSVRTDETN